MKKPTADKELQASALLALAVSRDEAAFIPASDEELAQLLEEGLQSSHSQLGQTRKAQLLDAIANDPATFNRWMLLVDAAETLELGGFAASAIEKATASSDEKSVGWLASLFQNPFKGIATAGSGLATAAVLMLMITTSSDPQSQIDDLYSHYGNQWQAMPAELTATRSFATSDKKVLSAEDIIVRDGVASGLATLGDKFKVPGLIEANTDEPGNAITIDEDLTSALKVVGQLAALSNFKCSLGAEAGYFVETLVLLESLQPTFEQSQSATSQSIVKNLKRTGDEETKVCRISKQLIERVSN